MTARFGIALVQLAGIVLVVAAVWNILDMWVALGMVGVMLLVGALGAENQKG